MNKSAQSKQGHRSEKREKKKHLHENFEMLSMLLLLLLLLFFFAFYYYYYLLVFV